MKKVSVAYLAPLIVLALACESPAAPLVDTPPVDNGPDPTVVVSISIASPLGEKLVVGRSTALEASPVNFAGAPVTTDLTWSSSNEAVARVTADGTVFALSSGTATVRATAGTVSGTLDISVVELDLAAINAILFDPWLVTLVNALPSSPRVPVVQAVQLCRAAVDEGNVANLELGLDAGRAALTQPLDADGTALSGPLLLLFDHVERLLNTGA